MKRLLLLALCAIASLGIGEGVGEWRPPDAGGATAAPGLIGSSASDVTLEWASTLTHAEFLPSLPRLYYSTADATQNADCAAHIGPAGLGGYPAGNDNTGDGSKTAPYRSLGRIFQDTSLGHVIAVMDACDSWANGTPVDGASDLECAAGAACTQTYLMNVAGGTPHFSWASTTVGMAEKCNDPDGVCFAIVGSDPSGQYRPKTDFATIGGASAIVDWFVFSTVAAQGWMHFENLRMGDETVGLPNDGTGDCAASTAGDLFRVETGAANTSRISIVNVEAFLCSPGTVRNEFWTSHHADAATPNDLDFMWSINSESTYPNYAGVGDQGFVPYINAGQSAVAIVGGFARSQASSAAAAATSTCLTLSSGNASNYGFVYDWDCVYENNTAPLVPSGFTCQNTLTTTDCRMFVARSRVLNAGGANNNGFFSNSGTGTSVNVAHVGYRNSSIGNDAYASFNAQLATGQSLLLKDRCSLHWKGTPANTDNALVWQGAGADCAGLDVDFVQTGVVQSDTVVLRVESNTAATLALVDALVATRGCHDGVPFTNFSATAIALATNPFGMGGSSGIAATTAVDAECTVGTITESFRHGFYGPAHIFGRKVTGAILNPEGGPVALGR